MNKNMKNKEGSNYQDLIKTIAILSMVIDHLGLYLFPECDSMRLIGRIAMPIFCFFAGYNFKGKPKNLILLYGVSLYIVTTILFSEFLETNILISIYLGQCYIFIFHDQLKRFFYSGYPHVIFAALLWHFTKDSIDYGSLSISIMILGYIAKHDKNHFKLASSISIILQIFHTIKIFNFPIYIVISIGIAQYLIMILMDLNSRIYINLNILSRNVLFIYFAHLIIIQLIWYYKNYGIFEVL